MAFLAGSSSGGTFVASELSTYEQSYDPVYNTPVDLSYLWSLLPSFYDQVADKEVFQKLWEGAFRGVSSCLLNLWQVQAARNLSTVPVFSQRKWLYYALYETKTDFTSITTAGVPSRFTASSTSMACTWVNRAGLDKAYYSLGGEVDEDASLAWEETLTVGSIDRKAGILFGYFQAASERPANALVVGVLGDSAEDGVFYPVIIHYSPIGDITFSRSPVALSVDVEYRVSAKYTARTSVVDASVFQAGAAKVSGVAGYSGEGDVYTNEFRDDSVNFDDEGVVAGDVLAVGDTSLSILSVDGHLLVVQVAALPVEASGLTYQVTGEVSVATLSLDLASTASDPRFTVDSFGTLSLDIRGASALQVLSGANRKRAVGTVSSWNYLDPHIENLYAVPRLQAGVEDPGTVLYEGTDYRVEGSVIQFQEPPTTGFWAEYSRYDEHYIRDSFGALVGLEEDSSSGYLARVQGVFYAYFRGPTPNALRTGIQAMLGLPIAAAAGTVDSINPSYSGDYGEVVVSGRSYLYPLTVGTGLLVGDSVAAYQALSLGVEIKDWVNDPDWFSNLGVHELEKYHTFGVFLDVTAFDLQDLDHAISFVNGVKPTWKSAMFVVWRGLEDTVDTSDSISFVAGLNLVDDLSVETPLDRAEPAYDDGSDAGAGPENPWEWRYDQGSEEWEEAAASSIVYNAALNTRRLMADLYGPAQVNPELADIDPADRELCYEYLTGVATFTNGDTAVSGEGTEWSSEISNSDYVVLSTYMTGTGGETVEGENRLSDEAGFEGAVVGCRVWIGSLVAEVLDVAADFSYIDVSKPMEATATGVSWVVIGVPALWGQVQTVVGDDSATLATNFLGTSGSYLVAVVDTDYLQVFYDQGDELMPDEEVSLVVGISAGYLETPLSGLWTMTEGSNVVQGDADVDTGEVAALDFVVTPDGVWYRVAGKSAPLKQLYLSSDALRDQTLVAMRKAHDKLSVVGDFVNGNAQVQTSGAPVLNPGDWIQAVPSPASESNPVVQVDSVLVGPPHYIVLAAEYPGEDFAGASVIRRGDLNAIPLTVGLPGGDQDFTDWYGTVGGELVDVLPEVLP